MDETLTYHLEIQDRWGGWHQDELGGSVNSFPTKEEALAMVEELRPDFLPGAIFRVVEGSCPTCVEIKANGGFGPRHNASTRCESGKYPHCTCDTCF